MPNFSIPGRGEAVALAVAFVGSIGVLLLAVLLPVYETSSGGSSGTITQGSATLVEENGTGVLLIMGLPLLVTALVAWALWRRRDQRGAGAVAWVLTGALAVFNLLAMLSVGVFLLPVTAALVMACVLHTGRPPWDGKLAPTDPSATPLP